MSAYALKLAALLCWMKLLKAVVLNQIWRGAIANLPDRVQLLFTVRQVGMMSSEDILP